MASQFDMQSITTPFLVHLVGRQMRFARLFLLGRKLGVGRFKKALYPRFPRELVDLGALPAYVYLGLKERLGQRKAFEIMRVVLLTGGTAAQNLQFDTVDRERTFENFSALEIENNRNGLVRWNKVEVVERGARRFGLNVTRCMFHEFATAIGAPEMTPIICQIDNAMFNSYLPDRMIFDRGGPGKRIADGAPHCTFVWELRADPVGAN